jgi:hypothetical protein
MKFQIFCAVLFLVTIPLFAHNMFVGQWRVGTPTDRIEAKGGSPLDTGVYYRFNADGTGGVSESPEGNFIEDFSFLSWEGTGITPNYPRSNTLLLASGPGNSPSDVTVKLYSYTVNGNTVTVQDGDGNQLVFTRISGTPSPLNIRLHPLLGQWTAKWNGENHGGSLGTWSFLYRPDGTVKTYHHRLHQFDNAYLVRGNVIVIVGEWRFHPSFPLIIGGMSVKGKNSVTVQEVGGTTWDYQKKAKVAWKE